jgi:hypothetical protein
MHPIPPFPPHQAHGARNAIICGGLMAGTFDLVFAIVYYGLKGATSIGVMQSIAGGLLGNAAREGGARTALLGVGLHFVISFSFAAVYWLASRRHRSLTLNALVSGLLYGVAVFYVMNMVVLPLSAYHSKPFPPPFNAWVILAHAVGVGLPIALATRYFARVTTMAPVAA